ncbi:MAG: acetyl-CoA carboxylase biotin carboxyl carrier protein [Proteobacteria bacterium]|nr:acetyl-CoA carboxylase biotin carboxyl carrier protein [Pseudomonadota bacterium]
MQPKTKKGTASRARAKLAAQSAAEKAVPGREVSEVVTEAGRALDVHAVKALIEAVEKSKLSRFVWQRAGEKLCIVRESPEAVAAALPLASLSLQPAAESPKAVASVAPMEVVEPQGHVIVSPFVGTFYRAPGPEQPPFAELGSNVRKGQALCIVEAMKLMNEIEADVSGKVVAILVDNAQPVEFGQPLFRLEPSP